MCGIAGFWSFERSAESVTQLKRMTDAIKHRGPDAEGHWLDEESGVALGHRRLSILDLSEAGSQPMASRSGRFIMVFNGEVYNFADVRRVLEQRGVPFRGHSDTEVLLAAVEEWGVDDALTRFVGMFALAMFDREKRELHLSRDRLGEKPLYVGWLGKTLVFGSELRALRAHAQWQGEISRDALSAYLRYAYVPAPHCIYQGFRKITPGTILTFRAADVRGDGEERIYWNPTALAREAVRAPLVATDAELLTEFERLLGTSVKEQMVADVPVGAFLSGGIDSSLVVALMQKHSARPVKTFTIGFKEDGFDEAHHAKRVAAHIGTDHTELYVTPTEALDAVPRMADVYDEPFADASQIPTTLVAALARRAVTVSLSGDGGDELFGGYNRHFIGHTMWRTMRRIPQPVRRFVARRLENVRGDRWDSIARAAPRWTPGALRTGTPSDRIHKFAGILGVASPEALYQRLLSQWQNPDLVVKGAREAVSRLAAIPSSDELGGVAPWMMFADSLSYLPDDIMVKVDRAAMAVGLESRAPLLDRRLVEFAWRVPMHAKIRDGKGKWLMRELLYKHVPRHLVERPKMGFGVPIAEWLRGPLRPWAESLLDPSRLRAAGFFNPEPIQRAWKEHLGGTGNRHGMIWAVLMFEAWRERQPM